jgi:sugar lactone lactonase YvrE
MKVFTSNKAKASFDAIRTPKNFPGGAALKLFSKKQHRGISGVLTLLAVLAFLNASKAPAQVTPPSACCSYSTDETAAVEVGQPSFTVQLVSPLSASSLSSPYSAFQAGTILAVGDEVNNRVLIYSPVPSVNGTAALTVVGQANFTSALPAAGSGGLSLPRGVWTNGRVLVVADSGNNRVLIYNLAAFTSDSGGLASIVIGQTSMTGNLANRGGAAPTRFTLNDPQGVFYDGHRLFISDTGNNRVLAYNTENLLALPPANAPADEVLGQAGFAGSTANAGGLSGSSLNFPEQVWVNEASQRIFVADRDNNRVLIYPGADTFFAPGHPADVAVGQASLTASVSPTGPLANNMLNPTGVSEDGCGRLFIADHEFSRVLVFDTVPTASGASADVVLGQPSLTALGCNQQAAPAANTLCNPFFLDATDTGLYVADEENNRVVAYTCGTVPAAAPAAVTGGLKPAPTATFTPTSPVKPAPTPAPAPITAVRLAPTPTPTPIPVVQPASKPTATPTPALPPAGHAGGKKS